jgi:hypothetical protein
MILEKKKSVKEQPQGQCRKLHSGKLLFTFYTTNKSIQVTEKRKTITIGPILRR